MHEYTYGICMVDMYVVYVQLYIYENGGLQMCGYIVETQDAIFFSSKLDFHSGGTLMVSLFALCGSYAKFRSQPPPPPPFSSICHFTVSHFVEFTFLMCQM